MAYTPDWEPLADALKRVMAAGIDEGEAKIDLCRAVADRKIDVRVKIAATERGVRGLFSDGNVGVPQHLRPDDLDWVHSRPFAKWRIGPRPGEHYGWIGGWENRSLHLIELSTRDLMDVLCSDNQPQAHRQRSHAKRATATDRARGVINKLYPTGVPDQAAEPNANLFRRVGEKLKQDGLPGVSNDTILRAAGRRK